MWDGQARCQTLSEDAWSETGPRSGSVSLREKETLGVTRVASEVPDPLGALCDWSGPVSLEAWVTEAPVWTMGGVTQSTQRTHVLFRYCAFLVLIFSING